MVPVARRDLPGGSIVLRGAEVSAEVRACFALRPDANPQLPAHHRALCEKGFQLDWDWVILFCFPANWVSGTGRTGQSGLGLAASWGCRRADHAGSGKGQGISLPSRPSPAPGPPALAGSSAPSSLSSCVPQGHPGEPQPAPSSGFHWGGPGQGRFGGGGVSVTQRALGLPCAPVPEY